MAKRRASQYCQCDNPNCDCGGGCGNYIPEDFTPGTKGQESRIWHGKRICYQCWQQVPENVDPNVYMPKPLGAYGMPRELQRFEFYLSKRDLQILVQALYEYIDSGIHPGLAPQANGLFQLLKEHLDNWTLD